MSSPRRILAWNGLAFRWIPLGNKAVKSKDTQALWASDYLLKVWEKPFYSVENQLKGGGFSRQITQFALSLVKGHISMSCLLADVGDEHHGEDCRHGEPCNCIGNVVDLPSGRADGRGNRRGSIIKR